MSATNSTPNYELPVFLATDKPAWLTDWNGAMQAIDTAIHDAQSTADGAQTTAGTAVADIATINASLSTITSNITSLTTTVNGNTGSINTINSLIGNGQPTTEDKTIIGAINEIYAMIGGGSSVDADIVVYDNTTSGLSATNVQSAIDEIVAGGAVDADDVTYSNTASGLTATNVQDAIDELASSGVGGVTYSTSEVDTGDVWTDGRHIYRKTFSGTSPVSTQSGSLYISSIDLGSDVDLPIKSYGYYAEGVAGDALNSFPGIVNNGTGGIQAEGIIRKNVGENFKLVFMSVSADRVGGKDYAVTIEYVKPTV